MLGEARDIYADVLEDYAASVDIDVDYAEVANQFAERLENWYNRVSTTGAPRLVCPNFLQGQQVQNWADK